MSATVPSPAFSPALRKRMKTLLFILLLFFSAGCIPLSDYENTQEDARQALVYLSPGHTLTQSLVLRRAPLESITLWAAAPVDGAPSPTALTLTLERAAAASAGRTRQTVQIAVPPQQTPLSLPVDAAAFPAGSRLRLTLAVPDGGLWLYGRTGEAYPDGALTLDGLPQNGDLAFRLTYAYGPAALWTDAHAAAAHLWLLLPLAAVLLLPGWVLASGLRADAAPENAHALLLAPALSAAFWPVLLAWMSRLRLPWGRPALLLVCALLLYPASRLWSRRQLSASTAWLPQAALGLVFLLSLGVRLVMTRDLAAPPWVDSVHHALITRLIVEGGAYPSTYAPYGQTANAHYHSGFHALLSAFVLLSGLDIPQAMLLLGQVLNALVSVLGVYIFTRTLHFSHRAGLLAALIASLFTPMPAYYLSWGRYTQLAGLLLLPAAFALWTGAGRRAASARISPLTFPLALLLAGLLITHYRVAAFLALLLFAWEMAHLHPDAVRRQGERLLRMALPALTGALLLALPWLWPALMDFIAPKTIAWSASPARQPWFNDFAWRYLTAGLGRYALGVAALGLGWALWKRRRTALFLLLWTGGMFLLANLGALGLPGRALVNNTSVEIALFLPVAALGGVFLDAVLLAWEKALPDDAPPSAGGLVPVLRRAYALGAAALLGAAVFQGLRATLPIVNPVTVLFHQADAAALRWMEDNLPADASVLINPAPWGYGLYVGSDGGYWISPLTGRRTFPPTLLYGWGDPAEIQETNRRSARLLEISGDPAALRAFMREYGHAYLYIGARGGPFSASALQQSGLFETLYHAGDVWVFAPRP